MTDDTGRAGDGSRSESDPWRQFDARFDALIEDTTSEDLKNVLRGMHSLSTLLAYVESGLTETVEALGKVRSSVDLLRERNESAHARLLDRFQEPSTRRRA